MSGSHPSNRPGSYSYAVAQLAHDTRAALARPLVKPRAPSPQEHAEQRAAAIFRKAQAVSGKSNRQLARVVCKDERMVRDYAAGARHVPLAVMLMLPIEARRAVAAELIDDCGVEQDEEIARVG